MRTFSKAWNSSKAPGKQRKYRARAPLHIKRKFMGAHLSPELRKSHGRRAIIVRKDDKVKVMRGQFSGLSGKVDRVDISGVKVYVRGVETTKKDGTKVFYPLHPSNLMITELNLSDKKRVAALKRR
ncbi:MAG: 50S ribosomal protein L24 [Candidatus Woesearchaeota archaeon]